MTHAYALVKGDPETAQQAAQERLIEINTIKVITPGKETMLCVPHSYYGALQEWYLADSQLMPEGGYKPGTLLHFGIKE